MALFLLASLPRRGVRLYASTNASGVVTTLELEADPGPPCVVRLHAVLPPTVDVTRNVAVDPTGATRRDTVNVPVARRWTYVNDLPTGAIIEMAWVR